MKGIVYSLFGYERARAEGCFDFNSYLRGLMTCLRFNRLIYPEWQTILETDHETYNAFEPLFKILQNKNILLVEKNKNGAKLCEAMLWRLRPVYWKDTFQKWQYSHIICRDLDSPSVYREAQSVQIWINHDKGMHAITDSVSHNLPLLGGMIGVRPDYFSARTNTQDFESLMKLCRYDLSGKGSDQSFLNDIIYPCFGEQGHESITQHYFKGHGKTWLNDFHTCRCWMEAVAVSHQEGCTENITLGIPVELKETDQCCQHIGSAGWNATATERFIHKHKHHFEDLITAEKLYPKIFTWVNE